MNILLDYEKYHKVGSHCLTTCLCTLFRKQGFEWSEELGLGLGSGLGFIYVRQTEKFILGGRGGNLEKNISSATGCNIISHKSEDSDSAWEYNRKMLLDGHALICDVDMSKLPYMVNRLNTTGSGFNGHKVLLVGFNDEWNEAYVLDYLWNNIVCVDIDDFKAAAGSSLKPTSPSNSAIYLDIPKKICTNKSAVLNAIDFNINQMKYPVGFGLGLKSMKRFFKEIKLWPEILTEDRLRYELNMSNQVLEKVGTGGGNFRRIYARFLKYEADIFENQKLFDAVNIYTDLGKLWKSLALVLYKASIDDDIYHNEIFENGFKLGNEILQKEIEGIEILNSFVEEEKRCLL